MTREEAVRRINWAAEENLTELDLAGLELEELPPEIGKCTQLETLVLGKFVMRVQAISIPYTVNYWL
jgi:Leucine-rich repeat (LRR) protein